VEKAEREGKEGLGRTLSLEDTENLIARHEADLGDAVRVTKGDTDLRWGEAFASELCDVLDGVLRGCLEPRWRCATIGQGRGRYSPSPDARIEIES